MPVCAILKCRSKSGSYNLSRGGISYHRFPREPTVRAKWIAATGRPKWWTPSTTSTICSLHFEPGDFVKKPGERRYLSATAAPSRYTAVSNASCLPKSETELCVLPLPPQHNNGLHSEPTRNINSSYVSTQQTTNLNDEVTSIEIEILPENQIIMNTQRNGLQTVAPESQNDNKIIEMLKAKIEQQELLIKKLKLRNRRLKHRLTSLKSMDVYETES